MNQPEKDRPRGDAIETLLIHADRSLNATAAVAPPIYQTATFRAASAEEFALQASATRPPAVYTRFGNPTHNHVAAVLAALEKAESALLTASGMAAATTTVLALVEQGAHVVAQSIHYGGTLNLLRDFLPKFGVEVTRVDQRDPANFRQAIRPNTQLILLESPSNPVLALTDLRAVAALAREHGILTAIDNTFASPLNQRPLELGIDLVFHSATKYLGGHSDLMAGVVLGSSGLLDRIWNHHVMLGAVPGPIDAWLLLRGLRTLAVRIRQHNENALALARYLESHPAVKVVHYPGLPSHPQHELARQQMSGFGGMLSFELKNGPASSARLLGRLRLSSCAASLGGVESLAVEAAANFGHYLDTREAELLGITPGLVRVSVGLEAAKDIIADYEQALQGV